MAEFTPYYDPAIDAKSVNYALYHAFAGIGADRAHLAVRNH